MKKTYKKSQMLSVVALIAFGVATVAMIKGMSGTVREIKEAAISRSPDAILASAGLEEDEVVSLPVLYYDQKADECVNVYEVTSKEALSVRQFEWSECGYYGKGFEQGLVDYYLGQDYLPVSLSGGVLTTNRGVHDEGFKKWFSGVEGESVSYPGMLQMKYDAERVEFSLINDEFYPLDQVGNDLDDVTRDSHNHLFTMNFAVPFTALANGNETFEIEADDDTWVYVSDRLVVDMGGVHSPMTGRFTINNDGEVYSSINDEELAYSGVKLDVGEGAIVRIFHADRDSSDSRFNMVMSGMNVTTEQTKLARDGDEGIQIAFDPSDPTYQAPLGATSVVQPNTVKGFITIVTLEGMFAMMFALLMAVTLRFMVKTYRDNKSK